MNKFLLTSVFLIFTTTPYISYARINNSSNIQVNNFTTTVNSIENKIDTSKSLTLMQKNKLKDKLKEKNENDIQQFDKLVDNLIQNTLELREDIENLNTDFKNILSKNINVSNEINSNFKNYDIESIDDINPLVIAGKSKNITQINYVLEILQSIWELNNILENQKTILSNMITKEIYENEDLYKQKSDELFEMARKLNSSQENSFKNELQTYLDRLNALKFINTTTKQYILNVLYIASSKIKMNEIITNAQTIDNSMSELKSISKEIEVLLNNNLNSKFIEINKKINNEIFKDNSDLIKLKQELVHLLNNLKEEIKINTTKKDITNKINNLNLSSKQKQVFIDKINNNVNTEFNSTLNNAKKLETKINEFNEKVTEFKNHIKKIPNKDDNNINLKLDSIVTSEITDINEIKNLIGQIDKFIMLNKNVNNNVQLVDLNSKKYMDISNYLYYNDNTNISSFNNNIFFNLSVLKEKNILSNILVGGSYKFNKLTLGTFVSYKNNVSNNYSIGAVINYSDFNSFIRYRILTLKNDNENILTHNLETNINYSHKFSINKFDLIPSINLFIGVQPKTNIDNFVYLATRFYTNYGTSLKFSYNIYNNFNIYSIINIKGIYDIQKFVDKNNLSNTKYIHHEFLN